MRSRANRRIFAFDEHSNYQSSCSSKRQLSTKQARQTNLLVLVAGVTNLMERSLAEVIDDNTLDPNAKLEFGAGGHSFDLFLNAVSSVSR